MGIIEQRRNVAFKVLIANDKEKDRQLIAKAWNEKNPINGLDFVSDGEELLAYLRQQAPFKDKQLPDLILMDLFMPKKNGFETLAEIKKDLDLCHIPIVILSNSGKFEDVMQCYAQGSCSYIHQPKEYTDLVEVLAKLRSFWFEASQVPTRPELLV